MFVNLFGELVSVAILLALGIWLFQHSNALLKLVGIVFALLALAEAMQSPSLVKLASLLAAFYVCFILMKSTKKCRKQAAKCRDCEHEAHGGGRCRNRYCRCDE